MKTTRSEISPLMQELSSYIASAINKSLPEEVVERAKVHIVDTFAAMISGSRLLPGEKAIAYVKSLGGTPVASVLGTAIVTSPPLAAFANGMFAHADETDDVHPTSRTHPGSGVIPAALAIGERDQLPGAAVLRAIVLGYDISVRLILAITELYFRDTGHQPTPFARVFGAAAAAAALLKLDARQVRFVLSYAAQQAAGMATVLRDLEHVEKAFQAGKPVHNGVTAALVVAQGFTGVEDVFFGKHTFFSVYAPKADLTQLTRGLGQDYEILHCAIKRWSVGGPNQAPLHLLHDAIKHHGFHAADVEKILVKIRIADVITVSNSDMANVCLEHLLAVMLADETVTFESTHDYERMKDPKVLTLRQKIEVVGDPQLTPGARSWRSAIEITLRDGRKITDQTRAAKGSFENPLTRDEEQDKAFDLIAPVLGKAPAQELLKLLWNFDSLSDIRALRKTASA